VAGNQISGGGSFQNQVATVAGGVAAYGTAAAIPGLPGVFLGNVAGAVVTNTVNAADPNCHPNVNQMGDAVGTGCINTSSGGGGGGAATGGHGGDASGGGDRGTRGGW
jgi:hypothetical protein